MKLVLQFANDGSDDISEDLDVEIPEEIWAQLEQKAKEEKCSVEDIVKYILRTVSEQVENEIDE